MLECDYGDNTLSKLTIVTVDVLKRNPFNIQRKLE